MTHMSNYGNDRLGLYTFESVIKFIQCWTNIKLSSAPPLQLAETYFKLYPGETDPVWGVSCCWVSRYRCDSAVVESLRRQQTPKDLVQEQIVRLSSEISGDRTAEDRHDGSLHFPLSASSHSQQLAESGHVRGDPVLQRPQLPPGTGLVSGEEREWERKRCLSVCRRYMNFFPVDANSSAHFYFEKSATYFDGELVPKRVHALLPHAKLVTILISPAKRAYSWYQHTKAHGDVIANNYSFHQVITASDTAPKPLRDLRNRCLNPGKYAQHLERWLTFFSPQSLHIIDGEELKSNPVEVMNEMQKFLKITPFFNYTDHLRFDPKKGFYCQVVSGDHTKCLGRSKGRQYPPMEEKSLKLLQRYYLSHNTALVKLMKRIGLRNIPDWLKDDLSDSSA